jgi:hypothetical protein
VSNKILDTETQSGLYFVSLVKEVRHVGNMSYCRFENTLEDLRDCYEAWNDNKDLSQSEARAKKYMLEVCRDIVNDYDGDDDDE